MNKLFFKLTVVGSISLMCCFSVIAQNRATSSGFLSSQQYIESNAHHQVSDLLDKIVGSDRYVLTITAQLIERNDRINNSILAPEKVAQKIKESTKRESKSTRQGSTLVPEYSITELESSSQKNSSNSKGNPTNSLSNYSQRAWPGFPAASIMPGGSTKTEFQNKVTREINNPEYTKENTNNNISSEILEKKYENEKVYFNKKETTQVNTGIVVENMVIKILLDDSVFSEMNLTDAKLKTLIKNIVSHNNNIVISSMDFPEKLYGIERLVYFIVPNYKIANALLFWGKYTLVIILSLLLGAYILFWLFRVILHVFNNVLKPKFKGSVLVGGESCSADTMSSEQKKQQLAHVQIEKR